ncbi:MAG: biopolymer transporter ExbD [Roseobacter sp.]
MDFSPSHQTRPRGEPIVPMINVVFLLLIFFLMSAQITPPDPFQMTPPESAAENDLRSQDTLYLSEVGGLWYENLADDAVWDALSARADDTPLRIKADHAIPARVLADILPKLAASGVGETVLVVGGK